MIKTHTLRLADAAELVQGTLVGDGEIKVDGLNSIDGAGSTEITFLVNPKEAEKLQSTQAACVLVPESIEGNGVPALIKVKDPYLASAIIHNKLLERPFTADGIHARAYVGEDCNINDEVTIGPLAVIGDGVKIGKRVTIEAGTVVGDEVVIGDDCHLKANVTIAERCILGNKVVIHSGTVIGSDGYGYATDAMGNHVKRPQVGIVRIDNDVEIGSNVSVDRGAFGDTWIQSGVKIDNQVQVAHNVVVGPNSLLVAQVAIAGSTTLGRNVVVGGKAAINGHINLEDQVMIAAGSGVHNSQKKGSVIGGVPAIPIKTWAKATAVFAKLPDMYSEFRKMKKAVAALQEKNDK